MEHFHVKLLLSLIFSLVTAFFAVLLFHDALTTLEYSAATLAGSLFLSYCWMPLYGVYVDYRGHQKEVEHARHTMQLERRRIALEEQEARAKQAHKTQELRLTASEIEVKRMVALLEAQLKQGQFRIEEERFQTERATGGMVLQTSQWLYRPGDERIIAPPRHGQTEEPAVPLALPMPQIDIPTFREAWYKGTIHPEQSDALLCYQLIEDRDTRQVTGIRPVRGLLEDNCTILLTGESQSGKSTLMSNYGGQYAAMGALLAIVDPHLTHRTKSVARKLAPLADAFLTEPASDDPREIKRIYDILKQEADLRKYKGDSRYDWRPIVLLVDEILALMMVAKVSTNEHVRHLYFQFAVFLCELSTQYAKFGMSGILASQYATKSEFKMRHKGMDVDFRDGCVNQTTFRLPGNQASALGRIDSRARQFIPDLPTGYGYMAIPGKGTIRMASGNVQAADLALIAPCLSHNAHTTSFATSSLEEEPWKNPGRTSEASSDGFRSSQKNDTAYVDTDTRSFADGSGSETSVAESPPEWPGKKAEEASEVLLEEPGRSPYQKTFTAEQELQFLGLYDEHKSINKCFEVMRIGGAYHRYASDLLKRRKKQN